MLQEAEERRRAQEEERLAAGQDLDVRRMELEAQRRRLEQVLLFRLPASHPAFSTGPIFFPSLSSGYSSLYFLLKPFYDQNIKK